MNEAMYKSINQLKSSMTDIRKNYIKESNKWRYYQRYHKLRD